MHAAASLDLEPEDDTIFRFLSNWFAGCNRGAIELGWTDEQTGKLALFRRFALDDINAATRFAAETNARPGCSVYFRPATVKLDSQFTRDRDVVQIPGCWADCDTAEAVDRVLAAAIVPSMQIVTGRQPSLRAQFLWKFSTEPILVSEWSRGLNRQANALAGGDPAVCNPSTLLRLPGTIAWPWKQGRVAELTEWATPDGGGHTFTVATLRSQLPQVDDPEQPASSGNGADPHSDLLNATQSLIDQARAGPLWHDPVLKLTARLVALNTPSAAILAMAEHLTWPDYTVTQTRAELAKMIAGARQKGFGDGDDVDDVMNVPPKAPVTFPGPDQGEDLRIVRA